MHILSRWLILSTLAVLGIFLGGTPAQAQFHFPSPEVLQDQGIKQMTVYRKALRFQGGPPKERKSFSADSSTRSVEKIFYFNEWGSVSKILTYPTDSGFYQKDVLRYDEQNRLVEHIRIGKEGTERARHLYQQQEDKEWRYQKWEYGKLRLRQKITADSLVYESRYFTPSDTASFRTYSFDFERNLSTTYWQSGDGEFYKETYQWFAEEGEPRSFKHTLEEKTKDMKRPEYKEKVYDLDAEGNVVNKYMGRFDDPYISCNYYERFQKLQPIHFPEKSRFQADQLIQQKEVETLYTFSGVKLIMLYEMVYE